MLKANTAQDRVRLWGYGVVLSMILVLSRQSLAKEVSAYASYGPANDLALMEMMLSSAQRHIQLNSYTFASQSIAKILTQKIRDHVSVEILVEGQPYASKIPSGEKETMETLVSAMRASSQSNNHFYVMTNKAGGKRRYHFDHAKYFVVDDTMVYVSDNNILGNSPTGNGTVSSSKRSYGWGIGLNDPATAAAFSKVFKTDTQLKYGDILDIAQQVQLSWAPAFNAAQLWQNASRNLSLSAGEERAWNLSDRAPDSNLRPWLTTARHVAPFFSPHSLNPLLASIGSAQNTLDIELLYFVDSWGPYPEGKNRPSPLVQAVESAAANGVAVRILLNDDTVFSKSKDENQRVARTLNARAKSQGWNLKVRIANVAPLNAYCLHNKSLVADGQTVLISSINWDYNAVENNREAAVLVEGAASQYYQSLFTQDWANAH